MRAYDGKTKNREKTDYIVIHCSATGKQKVTAADINEWHRKQGWSCIGYHYVIQRDGTLEQGRIVDQVGAHVVGWNEVSLGICMVGGVNADDPKKAENNFTAAQFKTLELLLKYLKAQPQYRNAVVQGHKDFPKVAKACPSFDAKAWWDEVYKK